MPRLPHSTFAVGAGQKIHGGRWPGGHLAGGVVLADAVAGGGLQLNHSDIGGGLLLQDAAAGGALTGFNPPAWWLAAAVFDKVSIPGSAGPASQNTDAYSGLALRPADSMLIALAAGGHSDGFSNACSTFALAGAGSSWTDLFAGSVDHPSGVTYYPDGRPSSRHGYYSTWYVAEDDGVLLGGCRFSYGSSDYKTGPGMDVFALAAGDYLPRYTYPDITPWAGAGYVCAQDASGNLWTESGYKFTVSTRSWSKPGSGSLCRYPTALDTARNRIFALQWADGEGFSPGLGLQCKELDPATGNSRTITFNSSSAYTQWLADAPQYAGMAYCPLDGRFYFLHPGRLNQFYRITPNESSVWDMDTWTPGGITLYGGAAQLCKRLLWVPKLTGFVIQHHRTQNLTFIRMA